MINILAKEFIEQSIHRLGENTAKINACLNELSENDIWQSPGTTSNSIGNLVLHLCGNVTQYVISSLGETEDIRERDKEFSTKDGYTGSMLLNKLTGTVSKAIDIIKKLDEKGLMKIYSVQGFDLSGVGIIIHVSEHYSYHTGQIVFRTKQLKNKDMGFYSNIDLNKKNKN